MMEQKQLDLYEFLVESELQQYYNSIRNELKISMASHLKYASDEDLKQVGLSKPEIRRLRKFYEKFYPHGYLSKIKRLLQVPVTKEHGIIVNPSVSTETAKSVDSPAKIPNNKHIIPADSICVNKQLGIGEFGIVQQGVWTNGTERIQVAIKCLSRERMQSNPMEFLKEAAIMHAIEHENIVRLYGVVLDTESLMLVTELAQLRSLLECLKDSGLRVSFLTVPTLCEFAMQICSGMMYLENKRLIHRDLASRNVLVFSKDKVKISDFGLSRALGVGKDYYQTNFNVNLKLPIAWCAPECINFLRFTNASDVWGYGVCLWEMFSYGFQPWPAFTGHQILEAIDHPNCQRLEAPECAPKEYYSLMLKCWEHIASKRPKFSEIYAMLPDMKPEQLKTVVGSTEPAKKEFLFYRQNEIITVLDKCTNSPYWKGVLNSGKTGLFNPANTVTYLGSLPSSSNRDSFCRSSDRSSKRKLRTEMISRPQNDLKHTGHVGLDGAYFGDIAFMSSVQNYNHVPRQIVTPYKPSEDIEQTPLLLPPTPTSPDSLQTASGYFPETMNAAFNSNGTASSSNNNDNFSSVFEFPNRSSSNFSSSNPFVFHDNVPSAQRHNLSENSAFMEEEGYTKDQRLKNLNWSNMNVPETSHEYHEISDDEMAPDKFDLGPSLLDEMDFMFRSMSAGTDVPRSPDFENTNKKNEITELTAKLHRKITAPGLSATLGPLASKSKKKSGAVKPISNKDEKILNQAIDFANEISARSMTDLVSENATVAQSPKRKFSFRFPNLSHHSSIDKDQSSASAGGHASNTNTPTYSNRSRNFSEEIKNVPDLQRFRSLTEIEKYQSDIRIPLFDKESADFCFEKSRELLSKPINLDVSDGCDPTKISKKTRDFIGENLLDIENTLKALNLDFMQTFNELEKTDSAETLFGDIGYQCDAQVNPKIRNSAVKLPKAQHNFSGGAKVDISPNSTIPFSPLDKQPSNFISAQFYGEPFGDKIEDKRSSTPDTGFASRETNTSSRRSSQKSSYSPQESHYSPREFNFSNQDTRAYINEIAHNTKNHPPSPNRPSIVNTSNNSIHSVHTPSQNRLLDLEKSFPSRQRSMSFTDNYDLKSPVLSEPQNNRQLKYGPSIIRQKPRSSVAYKPKSIKARNLRRLSYNPIVLESSSSSSSENEFDRSIAHSECDIRSTTVTSRRRRQYLNRKLNDSSNAPDKLYGSNTSIKSAPQYNYVSDRQVHNYLDQKFSFGYGCEDGGLFGGYNEGPIINGSGKVVHPRGGGGFEAKSKEPPMTHFNRNILFSEFDVSKLTGKSPTTQSFLQEMFPAGESKVSKSSPGFQWPEKIHASTVKQNDLMWRQQNTTVANPPKIAQTPYTSDSSSTETDIVADFPEYQPIRMPPSPAP
ncbi:activated Cdc42 kinase-like isoform X1 [Bradysia coprophila]|uniref:activated Cdc42 kinase-like isoform X1 n=1 Tax=Bradysia coprophila TaxID=38358 RepID=UPI00187DD420|nr:activated Cdc42 kinase-like isoform X1 [Bradysia coprophila]